MKRILATAITATLLAAAPAFAGHGHDHGRDWDKHERKEQKHREKEWRKAEKHAWKHGPREVYVQRVEPVVVERHVHYVQPAPVYYQPEPVYMPAAPAAINIHIPLR